MPDDENNAEASHSDDVLCVDDCDANDSSFDSVDSKVYVNTEDDIHANEEKGEQVLMNTLVKPQNKIVDYVTRSVLMSNIYNQITVLVHLSILSACGIKLQFIIIGNIE